MSIIAGTALEIIRMFADDFQLNYVVHTTSSRMDGHHCTLLLDVAAKSAYSF